MIIDSKKYNGKCSCGHEHNMTTEFCVIEAGCMEDLDYYTEKYKIHGSSAAIYDENTYKAAYDVRPKVDKEIILSPNGLHADKRAVASAMAQIPESCDYLIAIGSGTIHDITRFCAYKRGIDFVSCPTAASVDGFCSSVAAMTWDGFKKTFEAAAPKIVIADLNIISNAPMFLTKSGFGDMVGKFIALADWKISHILTNEYFCPIIHDMTLDAAKVVTKSTFAIKSGDMSAFENLTYGLLMSGLAMQLLGNSRCASGAEHHISHLIEMQPEGLNIKSDALHGEKVGVGTLLACKEYYKIKSCKNITFADYSKTDAAYIMDMFGERLGKTIINENSGDCACGITSEMLEKNLDKICAVINTVPTFEELSEKYEILGVKASLGDIGVPEEKLDLLLDYSPLVRNRLTLMRLRKSINTKNR